MFTVRCQAQADERAAMLKEQMEARRQAVFDRVQREAKAEVKQNEVGSLINVHYQPRCNAHICNRFESEAR